MGVRIEVRSAWATTEAEGPAEAAYDFDQARVLIGRGRGADVRLPHRAVSVRHATLEVGADRCTVEDHGSTNGTRVNGVALIGGRPRRLRDGDRIAIGGFELTLERGVAVAAATGVEGTAAQARRLARGVFRPPPPPPTVVFLNGPRKGDEVPLPPPPAELTVGRGDECGLVLPDEEASRQHALLVHDLDGVRLQDLSSKNGVAVNERGGATAAWLRDGDRLRIGRTELLFEDPEGLAVAALQEGEDETVDALPAVPQPSLEAEVDEEPPDDATPPPDAPPSQPPEVAPRSRRATVVPPVDAIIYLLASVVFALSLLGLLWLLRS